MTTSLEVLRALAHHGHILDCLVLIRKHHPAIPAQMTIHRAFFFSVRSFLSADANCPTVLIGLATEQRLHLLMSRKFESDMGSNSSVILTPQLKLSAPPAATIYTTRLFLLLYIWVSGSHTLARVTGSSSSPETDSSLSCSDVSDVDEDELSGSDFSGAGGSEASALMVVGCTYAKMDLRLHWYLSCLIWLNQVKRSLFLFVEELNQNLSSAWQGCHKFFFRKAVMALYHKSEPSRWPGSTFPRAKLLVTPLGICCMHQSGLLLQHREEGVTNIQTRKNCIMVFLHLKKDLVGRILEMMRPLAGEKKLSRSGSSQANSLTTNLDRRNQIGLPLLSCFSLQVRTNLVLSTLECSGTVSGLWSTASFSRRCSSTRSAGARGSKKQGGAWEPKSKTTANIFE